MLIVPTHTPAVSGNDACENGHDDSESERQRADKASAHVCVCVVPSQCVCKVRKQCNNDACRLMNELD